MAPAINFFGKALNQVGDGQWYEKYHQLLEKTVEFGEKNGGGLLTRKQHESADHYFTENDVKFIPLDQRSGEAGKDYFRYLNEDAPDNPYDSYAIICNNNPFDTGPGNKLRTPHFGHTWLHLNASGKNEVIQYYATFEMPPKQLAKFAAVAGVPGLLTGLVAGPLAGAVMAAFTGTYFGSFPAAPTSLGDQKSFHNALIIPLRRRQAEIIRVDTEFDKTGELQEYNFTNTLGRFKTGEGNCTSDAMARLDHVGIPITKAIDAITPEYDGVDIWGKRDLVWGVDERPGRNWRAIDTLRRRNGGLHFDISASKDSGERKNGGFSFDECSINMPGFSDNFPVIKVSTHTSPKLEVPAWDNPADAIMKLAEQNGVYIEGGALTDKPTKSSDEYMSSLKPASFVHNGYHIGFEPGLLKLGAEIRKLRQKEGEKNPVHPSLR